MKETIAQFAARIGVKLWPRAGTNGQTGRASVGHAPNFPAGDCSPSSTAMDFATLRLTVGRVIAIATNSTPSPPTFCAPSYPRITRFILSPLGNSPRHDRHHLLRRPRATGLSRDPAQVGRILRPLGSIASPRTTASPSGNAQSHASELRRMATGQPSVVGIGA